MAYTLPMCKALEEITPSMSSNDSAVYSPLLSEARSDSHSGQCGGSVSAWQCFNHFWQHATLTDCSGGCSWFTHFTTE